METHSEGLQKLEIPAATLLKFQQRRAHQPRNAREEMLEVFLAKLNAARLHDGLKKMTFARLATELQHIPTAELHAFYMQCERANHFSRFFWWSLKPKT